MFTLVKGWWIEGLRSDAMRKAVQLFWSFVTTKSFHSPTDGQMERSSLTPLFFFSLSGLCSLSADSSTPAFTPTARASLNTVQLSSAARFGFLTTAGKTIETAERGLCLHNCSWPLTVCLRALTDPPPLPPPPPSTSPQGPTFAHNRNL